MLIQDQLTGYVHEIPPRFAYGGHYGAYPGVPPGFGEVQMVYDRLGNPVGAFPLIAALGAKLLPFALKALPAIKGLLPMAGQLLPQVAQALPGLLPSGGTPTHARARACAGRTDAQLRSRSDPRPRVAAERDAGPVPYAASNACNHASGNGSGLPRARSDALSRAAGDVLPTTSASRRAALSAAGTGAAARSNAASSATAGGSGVERRCPGLGPERMEWRAGFLSELSRCARLGLVRVKWQETNRTKRKAKYVWSLRIIGLRLCTGLRGSRADREGRL